MKTLKRLAVSVLLVFVVQSGGASGQTLTTLYSFSGSDGANPDHGLVQGNDGNFYGTTPVGRGGWGTVYQISPNGDFTNLWSFGDGGILLLYPEAELVQGRDSCFYGTTSEGGASNYGAVFRISSSGNLTNLHSFGGSDGRYPWARLVQGRDGYFYGTTSRGGVSTNCSEGCGTVFRISSSGSFTNLFSFSGSDGANPEAGLVQGSDGNFYGTTGVGGASGSGTVFRISSSGSFTNLYSFNGSDGAYPRAALVQGNNGDFYGRTYSGGGNLYKGTVFRISPSGSFTNLYSFDAVYLSFPPAGLVQGSDGNFYGTIYSGGASNRGTVFRISPSGDYTNLYSFSGGNDGYGPSSGLVQGCDGDFYGTTVWGGTNSVGIVFRLSVSLNPPANQISAIKVVGADVILTIPSVAGETYQLQYRDSMSSGDWANADGASVTNSIGALMTLTNFGGALQPQRFYRFNITP